MGPLSKPDEIYRISNFSQQSAVSEADVVDLWTREAGLQTDEAQRRLGELLLVATDAAGGLAGVTTAWLAHSEQLRLDFWHLRGFVARAHRRAEVGRRLLRESFPALEGRAGAGVLIELENVAVQQAEV